jgi:glutamyl/glutaminyl-tRNA synthetase
MRVLDLTGRTAADPPLVTRFAPSPTGYLHLGHVASAIHVWGIARTVGAAVLLRLEDHDRIRCRAEYEDSILEDLDWLGFVPDAGRHPTVRQSERDDLYHAALTRLRLASHVYTCRCSRRQTGSARYPGTCRHQGLDSSHSAALRVQLIDREEHFDDILMGPQRQHPACESGDLLIRDRDGHWTYHFAVTVDDFVQGVNLVIRGADLLESTGRQLGLSRLLGRQRAPHFAHHPLIQTELGEKLSKSAGSTGVRELRAAGWSPAQVLGRAAFKSGLTEAERELDAAAVSRFWDRI